MDIELLIFGINILWLVPCIIIYIIGWGFDRAFFKIIKKGYQKDYLLWTWVAHDAAVFGELYTYYLFAKTNPDYGYIMPLGVLLWTAGTFIMAFYQVKDNPNNSKYSILYYGDGSGNTPEWGMNMLTKGVNMLHNGKEITMASVSGVVRLIMVLISIYYIIM